MNCKGDLSLHNSLSRLQDAPGKLTFAPQEAFRTCWSCFWPVVCICWQAGREPWCPEQPKKEDEEASCTWWLLAPQWGTSTTVDPMGILGTAAYIPENLQVNLTGEKQPYWALCFNKWSQTSNLNEPWELPCWQHGHFKVHSLSWSPARLCHTSSFLLKPPTLSLLPNLLPISLRIQKNKETIKLLYLPTCEHLRFTIRWRSRLKCGASAKSAQCQRFLQN